MKRANKEALPMCIASISTLANVFAKPLGIPQVWQFLLFIPLFASLGVIFMQRRKIKMERQAGLNPPPPVAPLAAKKRVFWAVAISLVLGSLTMIPLLPYTVENFHPWLYWYVIPFQIVFVGGFLWFFWRKLFRSKVEAKY